MASKSSTRATYHHGDLPLALITEGRRLLAEQGLAGFRMREVARRAGVAPAAPAHHFGNVTGLLTAIAGQGFAQLGDAMDAAGRLEENPQARVIAMCLEYLAFGKTERDFASVMFRVDVLNPQDEQFRAQAFTTFDLFSRAVADASSGPDESAKTLWAMMQGLVTLDMIDTAEAERIVRFGVARLIR